MSSIITVLQSPLRGVLLLVLLLLVLLLLVWLLLILLRHRLCLIQLRTTNGLHWHLLWHWLILLTRLMHRHSDILGHHLNLPAVEVLVGVI